MASVSSDSTSALKRTPLYDLHVQAGARMVPFAGYDMPVQYQGILAEHQQCREAAALFDVSHMGQLTISGADAAQALESILPIDVIDLPVGKQRYGFSTNDQGGILDDLMLTRRDNDFFMVINAACKEADMAHMQKLIGDRCTLTPLPDRSLLALQGPQAVTALSRLQPDVEALTFMSGAELSIAGVPCFVTRSGYSGEDGFEISVHESQAAELVHALMRQPEVKWAGLGSRDTLRLEAGLCLYGHDIDTETTPLQAGLGWAIQKVRRPGGARAGGYPGAAVLEAQWQHGLNKKRVGLIGKEKIPAREGAVLVDAQDQEVGRITSGTISPRLNQPMAMGYVQASNSTHDTHLFAVVRGKKIAMTVCAMPFVPHRYKR